MSKLELVAADLTWPESPRWHNNALYFSDVYRFEVRMLADGVISTVAKVPGRPAGIGFFPDGRLLVASALDRKLWWVRAGGSLVLAADMSVGTGGNLNDMIVDPQGRAWIGLTGFSLEAGEPEQPGVLYRWTPGSDPVVVAKDVRFPNGIAISSDAKTLFLCETLASRILAFDINVDGMLMNRRVHAHLSNGPDGLCLDDEGGLWVAILLDREFQRISPAGQVLERLPVDALAVSCTFGGLDRRTLFSAISRHDFSDPQSRPQGSIFATKRSQAGAGTP